MSKIWAARVAASLVSCIAGAWVAGVASAAGLDYGEIGQPIHLVVGHPCCYTASWSIYIGREKAFWKSYLPAGSTVEVEVANAGPPVVNAMIAGKEHVGYLGDMPAIVVASKRPQVDVRIVATTALAYDQCNILLVRADAPAFGTPADAVHWLAGKQMAVPRGSCADRFAQTVLKREGVAPAAYVNQSIEVIASNFRVGKLDAAVVWEPVASQLINQGLVRRAASGINYGLTDAAFVTMRGDLVDKRPDSSADPKAALYEKYPAAQGGTDVRMVEPFAFPSDVRGLISNATAFLHDIKAIGTERLGDEAIASKAADDVLASAKLQAPVGEIKAQN